jgi:multidrug efflux pump subunit AcrA (membrane-fusion protein)
MLMPVSAWAHEGENEAFTGEDSGTLSAVEVDSQGLRALGITIGLPIMAATPKRLKATGEVQAAETRLFNVNAPSAGAVRAVYAKQGDTVSAGQPLAVINSVEIAQSLTNLLSERNKMLSDIERIKTQYRGDIELLEKELQLLQVELDRQQSLLSEGITSRRNFQQATNDVEKAKVKLSTLRTRQQQEIALIGKQLSLSVETAKGQLRIQGLPSGAVDRALSGAGVSPDITINAPVSGIVTFRDLTLGERIDSSKKLFEIVDLSPIWVVIDVFQEQLPEIQLGQTVQILTPANQRISGTISSIDSVIDPVKKTLHVRIVSANREHILRPGMFVSANIELGTVAGSSLQVPGAAIVEKAEKHYVYKREGDHFEPVEVTVGQINGDRTEVLAGLQGNEQIALAGAKQLLAQSMLKGHSDEHEGPGHDEHDAHALHEHASQAEPNQAAGNVMLFVGGALTAGLAMALFAFLSRRWTTLRTRDEQLDAQQRHTMVARK